MAVMRQSCGEGRPIVECELWLALGLAQLLMEGVDLGPVLQHFLLLGGEVWLVSHYSHGIKIDGYNQSRVKELV